MLAKQENPSPTIFPSELELVDTGAFIQCTTDAGFTDEEMACLLELNERADGRALRLEAVGSQNESRQKWLQFILRSRSLGFTLDEVRRLARIAHQSHPVCSEVHALLAAHVVDVREKARELKRMERALVRLKAKCQEGTLHNCPVIDELMG